MAVNLMFLKKVKPVVLGKGALLVKKLVAPAVLSLLLWVVVANVDIVSTIEVMPEELPSLSLFLEESIPARLRIPKLSIDTTFVAPLGLAENGEVAVPDSDTEVGWYQHSPTPGELGPAVILGHVDSYTGPAIFFYLGQLEEGDDIFVDRVDGSTAHFIVETKERYKQSDFPTEKIYGNINYAGLRLITCSGTYVKNQQRYTHNLVVYARLLE